MGWNHQGRLARQKGILLVEALIAVVIFSIGILGLIGLQTASVKQSTDAKYRSDASLLADKLVGKMWIGDRTATTLQNKFNSPSGTEYLSWLGSAATEGSVLATLPGADAHHPDVQIVLQAGGGGGASSSAVRIVMYWKAPYETGDEHQYTLITQIR